MKAEVLLRSYRFVFTALLLAATALTAIGSERGVRALAIVEIAGVLLFTWRLSRYLGAAILLAVFAFAEILSIGHGQIPTHLLQYAATVVFLVVLERQLKAHHADILTDVNLPARPSAKRQL